MLVYRSQCLCSVHSGIFTPLLDWNRCSKALSRHHSQVIPVRTIPSKIRRTSFFASDCVRNPSRCFVKRSAVLFFVSTPLTDRRCSRIHCCIAKHHISMCLSPPGPCAVGCVLPSLNPSRDELKLCGEVP